VSITYGFLHTVLDPYVKSALHTDFIYGSGSVCKVSITYGFELNILIIIIIIILILVIIPIICNTNFSCSEKGCQILMNSEKISCINDYEIRNPYYHFVIF